jgi:hypothetical protein
MREEKRIQRTQHDGRARSTGGDGGGKGKKGGRLGSVDEFRMDEQGREQELRQLRVVQGNVTIAWKTQASDDRFNSHGKAQKHALT